MSSSPGARLVAALLAFAALPSLAAQPAHAPVPMKAPTAAEIAAKWPKPVTRYENAPLAWRDFLQQARAADASKDPLQRCLAFPDFPDNQWPAQAAAQYCDWNFGPRPTLADIRKLLDAGDVQGLDKRYAELQALHQGHADFSERIHSAIDIFDSSYESGALSKRWLELAPDSPYAMAARGNFYMRIDYAKYPQATRDLLAEILRIQQQGDRAKAEAFIAEWTKWDPALHEVIAKQIRDSLQFRYSLYTYGALGE